MTTQTKAKVIDLVPLALSPKAAGQFIGVSREHIYDLINRKQIKASRSGTRWLVDYQALCEYYERISA